MFEMFCNKLVSSCEDTHTNTQHPSHPLHKHTTYFNTPRLKTLFSTTAATQQTFPQTLHDRGQNSL